MIEQIDIEWLGGNCPVQAEGTIDGKRFYFRARGEHWSLTIHPTASGEYLKWDDDQQAWEHEEEWGDGPFDAGWMPEEVAKRMIETGAMHYRASLKEQTKSEA